ncbi:MAG TPA: 50S ribosomal protein L11 methyltransferase [Oscillospiraceae bacterium]|nr:50S ribosomal protein L11 methyltransferase [Oscillospiraceae bacterium]
MDDIWNELTVTIPTEDTERAAAICSMTADAGIYIEDYSDLEAEVQEIAHIDLIEKDLLEKDRTHSLIHLYLKQERALTEAVEFLKERFAAAGIAYELHTEDVREEDWANNWKKYYHAQKIGEKLAVCPSWETYEPSGDEKVIRLDPGMAFGTGTHETTRLCLRLLEECVTEQTRLLDVGTGSGILAVGAALLGVPYALGVDIDPVAVRVAKENAALNGTSGVTEFVCGDLTEKVSGRFEIVTANIVADVIIRLLGTVKEFLLPGGALIVSGIIDTRADETEKASLDAGFRVEKRLTEGGWVAMLLRL